MLRTSGVDASGASRLAYTPRGGCSSWRPAAYSATRRRSLARMTLDFGGGLAPSGPLDLATALPRRPRAVAPSQRVSRRARAVPAGAAGADIARAPLPSLAPARRRCRRYPDHRVDRHRRALPHLISARTRLGYGIAARPCRSRSRRRSSRACRVTYLLHPLDDGSFAMLLAHLRMMMSVFGMALAPLSTRSSRQWWTMSPSAAKNASSERRLRTHAVWRPVGAHTLTGPSSIRRGVAHARRRSLRRCAVMVSSCTLTICARALQDS